MEWVAKYSNLGIWKPETEKGLIQGELTSERTPEPPPPRACRGFDIKSNGWCAKKEDEPAFCLHMTLRFEKFPLDRALWRDKNHAIPALMLGLIGPGISSSDKVGECFASLVAGHTDAQRAVSGQLVCGDLLLACGECYA